jgi:Ran GTPase-activating protein (RanGAP) involved in mRNA processing and transport
LPKVIALNTRTILSIFRDMKELRYEKVGWGDDEAVQLAEVLPLCTSATGLRLNDNYKISARGAKALAAAFADGAMPKLEKLVLYTNQIGDNGAVALAEAVGKGALPELKELWLQGNKLSQTGKDAWEAVKAKRRGLNVRL